MIGQPILWLMVGNIGGANTNWLSPAMLTALGAMFLAVGIAGTHTWMWWERRAVAHG
jgi:hypothetical protein